MSRAVLLHRAFPTAGDRVAYLLSPKPTKREQAAIGHRVVDVVAVGFDVAGLRHHEIARRLLLLSDVSDRCEVVEFLVSLEPNAPTPVETLRRIIVDLLRHLAIRRAFAVIHGDRDHTHFHLVVANDDGQGRSLQFDTGEFLALRTLSFTNAVEQGWRSPRKVEAELAAMSTSALAEEIKAGHIEFAESTHPQNKKARRLRWRRGGRGRGRLARLSWIERLAPGWEQRLTESSVLARSVPAPTVAPIASAAQVQPPGAQEAPLEMSLSALLRRAHSQARRL